MEQVHKERAQKQAEKKAHVNKKFKKEVKICQEEIKQVLLD
jgi:hypothetical protein